MNTISKMMVGCVFAILVVVISSGRYSMIQANAVPIISHQCTPTATGFRCVQEEVPIQNLVPDCRDLQTKMANDTPDHFYAGLYQQLGCDDILSRVNQPGGHNQ
jgi:hypothetical protein